MDSEKVVRRARALLGVPFRPQGRSRETGLDCIGVAVAALAVESVRSDYRLRGGCLRELEAALAEAGLRPARQRALGDLLVLRPGAEQLHLGIWTGGGLVHADAGLRRVVERPGLPPWPVLGAWRKEE